MKRRNWDAKTKTKVVLDGLSGRDISEICNEHGIQQAQYYRWRDQFLNEAHRVFEPKKDGGEVMRLRKQKAELQQIIGVLTVELKKSGDGLL